MERLQKRVTEKMESKDIDIPAAIQDSVLVLEIAENDVPEAVMALQLLPGVESIAPCILSAPDAEAVLNRLVDGGVQPQEFRLQVVDERDNQLREQDVIDALVDADWEHSENHDTQLSIQVIDDNAYIHLETLPGLSGLPVDDDRHAILPVRDRMDIYAGVIAMKNGFRVTPVVKGKQLDSVKEGLDILQELYPPLKPVTIQTDGWKDAVEQAVELLHPDRIVSGVIRGDEPLLDRELLDTPIWRPIEDLDEEKVLGQYQSLLPVTL